MDLTAILNKIYPIPAPSAGAMQALAETVQLPKGHVLLKAGKVERAIYFVKSGIVRAYANHNDTEITFWFGKEGDAVISMNSYVRQQPGYEDIELLEDCTLYRLSTDSLRQLYTQDIHVANWGRRFAEQELIKTEERLISRQFRTATERYCDLLESNPALVQRVSLGHVASYLGITQVSLSRIRAEIR